jgi:hypothetical protein
MIPVATIEAAAKLSTLEMVETPCDVGRVWDMSRGLGLDEDICPRSAEWSALAHDCHLGQPIMLCSKHLALCRHDHWPGQLTKWECERCGMVAVSRDEMVWNVRRIA